MPIYISKHVQAQTNDAKDENRNRLCMHKTMDGLGFHFCPSDRLNLWVYEPPMKVAYAARFVCVAFLVAALYTWFQMRPGLSSAVELSLRQAWVLDHAMKWSLGWGLWLLAIFAWMVLLAALGWSYLPAHRVSAMLQSGLMIIAATLAMVGILVWMAVLPAVLVESELAGSLTPIVDALALGLLGSSCFLGGATTIWIAFDLIRQNVLLRSWLLFAMVAGCCLLLAPFLRFNPYVLFIGGLSWLVWCLWLSTGRLPSPFPIWSDA